jgi:hypothetical protein
MRFHHILGLAAGLTLAASPAAADSCHKHNANVTPASASAQNQPGRTVVEWPSAIPTSRPWSLPSRPPASPRR